MTRVTFWMGLTVAALLATGCGSSVSDPCTTPEDCGGQICLNERWAPGGYCSAPCTLGDSNSCPGGSVCVRDVIARDKPGCVRSCTSGNDCRKGYICRVDRESPNAVCIGPDGF